MAAATGHQRVMDVTVVVIFSLVYVGMLLGELPGLALDRTGIALLGAIALVVTEKLSLAEARGAVDVPTICLLFGLMVVSAQFRLGGFYSAVTRALAVVPSDRRPRISCPMLSIPLALALMQTPTPGLTLPQAERFAELALACIHTEYPNKIAHTLAGDADVRPPRELSPVFFGCFDWHSSVHGHWLLARVARLYPETPIAARATTALARSFTLERIDGELAYLRVPHRQEFERPYGLAWLLQLSAELREWNSPQANDWLALLGPLEQEAVRRISDWLPKLTRPIRTGEHSQTAFAFGLALDWARVARDAAFEALLVERSRTYYAEDRACPMAYEPSGQDFVSPCLAEADLMRRVLEPAAFARWLDAFLHDLPRATRDASWLEPGVVLDPSDGKLAHLDGLNLSRAWMLEGILSALPQDDTRRPALEAAAARHREVGLAAVTGEHYAGGHWLGTFAMYLASGRGLR